MRRFHPDDRRVHEQVMAQVIEHPKIYDFEARILLPDGSERFILFTSEGLHDDQDTLIEIIGTVQEITNRTHIVAALRESEGRFRLAF